MTGGVDWSARDEVEEKKRKEDDADGGEMVVK